MGVLPLAWTSILGWSPNEPHGTLVDLGIMKNSQLDSIRVLEKNLITQNTKRVHKNLFLLPPKKFFLYVAWSVAA